MAKFSFYAPNSDLKEVEKISAELKVYGVELDESFLHTSRLELHRGRYESGLSYVALRLQNSLEDYEQKTMTKIALWCEANYVEAIIFANPGYCVQAVAQMLDWLDCFRVKIVFENKNDSFLGPVREIEHFFRNYPEMWLSYHGAEIAAQNIHPFSGGLDSRFYRKLLYMIRVQDICFNGDYALPCEGDGDLAECFSAAAGFGRNVWASITPYGGYSLAEIKTQMCKALCRV